MANGTKPSSYLDSLPAIFSEDPFLGQFLRAFEQILTGPPDADAGQQRLLDELGLEEIITGIALFFDPQLIDSLFRGNVDADQQRRGEFLDWLSNWVALSMRADWTLEQKQRFLADIVPLYRSRGTKENIVKLLRIYTLGQPIIDDGDFETMQIGKRSTIGKDTRIGDPPPHFFRVTIKLGRKSDESERERQLQIARALIDLQKPAHTNYQLRVSSDTMKINKRSTIGRDTLIADEAEDSGT